MSVPRTSLSHPIRVDWLHGVQLPGRVGLTIAPGKHSASRYTPGHWARDLDVDLARLKTTYAVDVLACLLEDADLQRLRINALPDRARAAGMHVLRLPIRDVSVLPSLEPVRALVVQLLAHARAGRHVVIHCEGGLGRAGTVGGCLLTALGLDAEAALRNLVDSRRNPRCPETDEQREFVRRFARAVATPGWLDAAV